MKPARRAAAALAAALALAACEEGLPGREPLRVNAVSGGKVDLTGTRWESCRDLPEGGSDFWKEVHGEEGAITYTLVRYDAPACTGAAGAPAVLVALGDVVGDAAVGWSGTPRAGLADPPPPASRVLLGFGGGAWAGDVYLVDDTVSPRVLYTGDARGPRDPYTYPALLWAGGEGER